MKMEELYVCWEQHYDDPIWIEFVGSKDKFEEFIENYKKDKVDSIMENMEKVEFTRVNNSINWKCFYKREHIASIYHWMSEEEITEGWGKICSTDVGFNYQIVDQEL